MAKNKIIYGGVVQMDITDTTATPSTVLDGFYFYGRDGEKKEGSCTYDSDTSDATATAGDVSNGEIVYVNGNRIVGTMPVNGAVSGVISDVDVPYTIPVGSHDGSGTVVIDSTEVAKLKNHNNIKNGVTILGETGSYSGEAASVESNKNVTPSTSQQVVQPSTGYDYLAQVTVAPIPYAEIPNAYGTTVSIG